MKRFILIFLLPILLFSQSRKLWTDSLFIKDGGDWKNITSMISSDIGDSLDNIPDNITIERLSGKIQIKDAGIGSIKLGSAVVTHDKIATTSIDSFMFDNTAREFIETHATTGSVTINNNADGVSIDTDGSGNVRVKPGGDIQNININDLTFRNKEFIKTGTNKFNVADTVHGYYVNWNTGALAANTNYIASGFINIVASQEYTWNDGRYLAWYDTDHNYILGLATTLSTHTSPINAAYVRFSFSIFSDDPATTQMEEGAASTTYESYRVVIDYSNLDISDNEIENQKLESYEQSINLINPLTITNGYYVSWIDGDLDPSASYSSSDYISISSSTYYSSYMAVHCAWYTDNKTFISGVNPFNDKQQSPGNAAYIRVDYLNTSYDSNEVFLTQSTELLEFEPYLFYLKSDYKNKIDIRLQLPDTIFVAATDTTEVNIFFENIIIGRSYKNYSFYVDCDSGSVDYRRWHWIPDVNTSGNYKLVIQIQDREVPFYGLGIDSTIISVARGTFATTKTILMIGNSLTDDGSLTAKKYPSEVYTMSSQSYALNFIGLEDASTNWANEGHTGWRYSNFCASGSPFYISSTNTFDIANYLSANGFGNPDYITIGLGTNDVYHGKENTIRVFINTAFAWQDTMVNDILSALPNCKIGLFLIIPPAYEQNSGFTSGAMRDAVKRSYHEFNRRMIAKWGRNGTDKNARVSLIPVAPGIDTEYNYTTISEQANARNSETISIQSNNVHPNQYGYYQIADCVFGWIVNHYADWIAD